MNIDANGEKELSDKNKDIEDGVLGERCSPVQVGELKVDAGCRVKNFGATSRPKGSGILRVHQQPAQASVVFWERFLHVRSIRVLLVENDDSTRHVVTALLRNCNYKVIDAANGLQAWKVLEDLTNHIDIILTEVVMPCLSGISLLCKIMSHKTRKNIPVIMMSSHDSMSLVFKCLSKGAVDFLVKPIRKNELKNLWQHVWRRCHSSSGSGSESGTQTQKSVKSKGSDQSGNIASDDGENDASNELNTEDGSDDGSGAQSSWTKQAVEVDSSQALSPMDQVPECPDRMCAQVIHSNAEFSNHNKVQVSAAREGHGQELPGNTAEKSTDLETIAHKNVVPKSENHGEGQANPTVRESEFTREVANKLDISNNASDDCKGPNLELTLKRLRGVQDTGGSIQDERYVLRRSEQSAFSSYSTSANIFKSPNIITGSSSILYDRIEATKRELVGDIQVFSTDHIAYQSSNGVSINIDMSSTINNLPKDKSEATSAINGLPLSSAFGPVKSDLRYSQQQVSLLPNGMQSTELCPKRSSYQDLQIHQNLHHCHHNFHKMENQPSSNHNESSMKQLLVDDRHCGSTNALGGPLVGTSTRNCCLNRSASGSNHGSNGQNGSSTAVNAMGNNAESDVGQAGKSGSGDTSRIGNGNKADEIRFLQREAALIKFRLKRKERCFKKKVRYQTRKKLAEERPRVRGQFVKQSGTESSNRSGDE